MEDVNKRRRIFLSLSKLECGPQEINSREYICLHLKFSERLKKTRIHFKSGVFAAVAHSCGLVTGPGVPRGFSSYKLLQVQSSQKSFCHFNNSTRRQVGLRSRHPRRLEMRIPTNRFSLAWEKGIQVPFPFFVFA